MIRPLFFTILLGTGAPQVHLFAQTTLDLSAVGVRVDSFVRASPAAPDTLYNVEGVHFRSVYDTSFGGFWSSGWAFSRSTDTTGNFRNLYGVVGGVPPCCVPGSDTYLSGQQGAYLLLPPNSSLVALEYNNLAYTAATLKRGSGFSKVFGRDANGGNTAPDSLILSVCGYLDGLPTFVKNLPLADFRAADSADDYIVNRWTPAQLTPSARFIETDSVAFRLRSSDNGDFGNNTPDFFAIGKLAARLNVTALKSIAKVAPVKVYPIPTRDWVAVGEGEGNGELTIADATGRIVEYQDHYLMGSRVQLSNVAAGVYYASLRVDGKVSAARFIVQ